MAVLKIEVTDKNEKLHAEAVMEHLTLRDVSFNGAVYELEYGDFLTVSGGDGHNADFAYHMIRNPESLNTF